MKALEREPDERLLIEAAQRERAHFAELYEQNFERIYAFVAHRVSTRDEAQDLTAEVFHQALASIHSFKWQGAPLLRGSTESRRTYSRLIGRSGEEVPNNWQRTGSKAAPTKLNEERC